MPSSLAPQLPVAAHALILWGTRAAAPWGISVAAGGAGVSGWGEGLPPLPAVLTCW